jgi:hypothetical protein
MVRMKARYRLNMEMTKMRVVVRLLGITSMMLVNSQLSGMGI